MCARVALTLTPRPAAPPPPQFHALCVRILRRFAREANLEPSFSILDRADQEKVVEAALSSVGLGEVFKVGQVVTAISLMKHAGELDPRGAARIFH